MLFRSACFIWGLNFSIRRNALFDAGGFHPDWIPKPLQRFQGDGETGLSLKAIQAGLKALYHPQAAVRHHIPTSRMTMGFFEERAYASGICASYTQIRRKAGREILSQMKQFLVDVFRRKTTSAPSLGNRQLRMECAFKAGYAFHQEEVRRDPSLLDWVLDRKSVV